MFSGGSGFVCTSVVCSLFSAGYALELVNLLGTCCSCNYVRFDLMLSHIV